jgi:ABC-2 type transport system ATP-binding protein
VVESDGRAGLVEPRGGKSYEFKFDGGPDAASDLLTSLVHAWVRVASFAPKREGLEDVFLKVGAKEVS